MYRYVITLEEIDDARNLRDILEDVGDTSARVNQKKREVIIDTSCSITEICEVLSENGYEIEDLEMIN